MARNQHHFKRKLMIRLKSLLCEWEGESWRSCRQWASHQDEFTSGDGPATITLSKSAMDFELMYVGPDSGISIAHAKGGKGDTLHQLFNVLICEINPWLADTMYKPLINDIATSCSKRDSLFEFTITVPLVESDTTWQLNHRGGWGHDPGIGAVRSVTPNVPQREIATNTCVVPGQGTITTYFAVYPI
jgi:hypothetical protein